MGWKKKKVRMRIGEEWIAPDPSDLSDSSLRDDEGTWWLWNGESKNQLPSERWIAVALITLRVRE